MVARTLGSGVGVGHGSTTEVPKLIQKPMPRQIADLLPPSTKVYELGECTVFTDLEERGYHMSISHPERLPTWDEIATAWYGTTPKDTEGMLVLPKPGNYVNIHKFCMQVHQLPEGYQTL